MKDIVIKGAREHNLQNIDVSIELGKMIAVTGVSGSGKSTLVNEVLFPSLSNKLMRSRLRPGEHDGIDNTGTLIGTLILRSAVQVACQPFTLLFDCAMATGIFLDYDATFTGNFTVTFK